LRGLERGACLTPALLRRTAFGVVTPNSSDIARNRDASRLAGRFLIIRFCGEGFTGYAGAARCSGGIGALGCVG
jgi:hypothetical protein